MPGRNIYKEYVAESYYHVYNKGINDEPIFIEARDYQYFLKLINRYLGNDTYKNSAGVEYNSLRDKVELLTYCLMSNHFHLLIYQIKEDGMKQLLRQLGVAYAMYFNKKYHRKGPLFQQRYRASLINKDDYLLHISRYIHLNPEDYRAWEWSSLAYYVKQTSADWLKPNRILKLFDNDYVEFVSDYKSYRDDLKRIRHALADNI